MISVNSSLVPNLSVARAPLAGTAQAGARKLDLADAGQTALTVGGYLAYGLLP